MNDAEVADVLQTHVLSDDGIYGIPNRCFPEFNTESPNCTDPHGLDTRTLRWSIAAGENLSSVQAPPQTQAQPQTHMPASSIQFRLPALTAP